VNIHWIHCIENFFTVQHLWTTCTCPEKQSFPWKSSLYWLYTFYHSGFLTKLRLRWKTDLTWNSSLYWSIFIIQDFWATYTCPENFHCIEYTFYIQDFWATCACLEEQSVPWIHFECIFFIIQDFWATYACAEKQSCPEIFHCFEIFFILQEFWATCASPENRICPEIFQAGGRQSHPPRTPMSIWYRRWKHYILWCLENDNFKTAWISPVFTEWIVLVWLKN